MNQENQNNFYIDEENETDYKVKISLLFRYWYWIALSLVFFLTGAYLYLRYTTKTYQSTSKIKILDKNEGLELPTAGFVLNRSSINLENEIEVVQSYLILEKVVKRLNLTTVFTEVGTIQTTRVNELPFYFKIKSVLNDGMNLQSQNKSYTIDILKNEFVVTNTTTEKSFIFQNHNSLDIEHDLPFDLSFENIDFNKQIIDRQYVVNFKTVKGAILELKKNLKVKPIDGSNILNLSYSGESMALSESILNSLIDVFNNDGIRDRQLVSERTINFIDERFQYLAQELDSIEINYQDFKEDNNIVDIESDAVLGQQQQSLSEEKLFKLENQLELIKLMKSSLNDANANKLLPSNIGLENENVNVLISEYNLAVMERDKLSNAAGINNPSLKLVTTTVLELKMNINASLDNYLDQLTVSKRQFNERALKFSGNTSSIPEKQRLLRNIVRQQQIKESLYLLLLQKREEAAINYAITEPSIKVVEFALSNSNPLSPKSNMIYLGAFLAALFLPLAVIYLILLFDTKIHFREDIEKVNTETPILAEIPEIKNKGSLLFTNPNSTSVLAESFRILAANVSYVLPKSDKISGKVIFSTSTIKGEGKTFVSLNLSLALASLNKKVLLIGADMRNPQIHTYFGTSKNQVGLSSYLNDASINWKELLMAGFDKHPKHRTLLSGAIPPNPAHLLTNGRFEKLLAEARTEFDYIIVDTAPTILVTDTLLISKFADATLFLTKANYTDKKLLKFSKELSESGKIQNMAYVMNSVGAGKSYAYGYGYGYNYGYSYGYHEEN